MTIKHLWHYNYTVAAKTINTVQTTNFLNFSQMLSVPPYFKICSQKFIFTSLAIVYFNNFPLWLIVICHTLLKSLGVFWVSQDRIFLRCFYWDMDIFNFQTKKEAYPCKTHVNIFGHSFAVLLPYIVFTTDCASLHYLNITSYLVASELTCATQQRFLKKSQKTGDCKHVCVLEEEKREWE